MPATNTSPAIALGWQPQVPNDWIAIIAKQVTLFSMQLCFVAFVSSVRPSRWDITQRPICFLPDYGSVWEHSRLGSRVIETGWGNGRIALGVELIEHREFEIANLIMSEVTRILSRHNRHNPYDAPLLRRMVTADSNLAGQFGQFRS